MKTYIICLSTILLSLSAFSQEGLKIGISAGYPLGDAGEPYIVNFQGNLDYLFHITEEIHVGVTTGYSHFLNEDSDAVNSQHFSYLPLGATAQFNISDTLKVAGDIGYGLVLSPDNVDGGLFFAPKVQYMLSEKTDLVLAYRSLTLDGSTIDTISVGFEFGFPTF